MSEISCDEVLEEIEHFLHGELDPSEAERLERHLGTCPPCFDKAEFQRTLKEIVRYKCRSEAPQSLVWRIREAIHLERRVQDS